MARVAKKAFLEIRDSSERSADLWVSTAALGFVTIVLAFTPLGSGGSMATTVNEQRLDERLALLEKARTWSPRLISKLESHIRTADDRALYRINPFTFAKERNIAEIEVVDLFLHATALGVFSMDWNLFCPKCCCVVDSFRSLKSVHNNYHCAFC